MAGEPTLRRGHSNPHDWVVYAQRMINYALASGMHLDVPENGIFDEAFEQEVIAFQSRHGLGPDGEIGPGTWAALHQSAQVRQQASAAAAAEEDDQLTTPPREVHSAPGHKDDNIFRERTDAHGNTVRVYDMDEQNIRSDHTTWNEAVTAMSTLAEKNIEMQIPWVNDALQEFQESSGRQIKAFAQEAHQFLEESHVQIPWGLLVDALEKGLSIVFEMPDDTIAEKWGNWIIGKVKDALTSQLKSELEARADPVANLQERLETGVAALIHHVRQQTRQAVGDVQAVLLDYIEDRMSGYQQVSGDPEWIREMVAWFGFPTRTAENVTQPILHYLNHEFGAMIQQAQQEVLASG